MAFFYRPRIADLELRFCLAVAVAVVIEGPKACGKTMMAKQLAASTVLLDVDNAAKQALVLILLTEWLDNPAISLLLEDLRSRQKILQQKSPQLVGHL